MNCTWFTTSHRSCHLAKEGSAATVGDSVQSDVPQVRRRREVLSWAVWWSSLWLQKADGSRGRDRGSRFHQ